MRFRFVCRHAETQTRRHARRRWRRLCITSAIAEGEEKGTFLFVVSIDSLRLLLLLLLPPPPQSSLRRAAPEKPRKMESINWCRSVQLHFLQHFLFHFCFFVGWDRDYAAVCLFGCVSVVCVCKYFISLQRNWQQHFLFPWFSMHWIRASCRVANTEQSSASSSASKQEEEEAGSCFSFFPLFHCVIDGMRWRKEWMNWTDNVT